jgi:hypothetical protein
MSDTRDRLVRLLATAEVAAARNDGQRKALQRALDAMGDHATAHVHRLGSSVLGGDATAVAEARRALAGRRVARALRDGET